MQSRASVLDLPLRQLPLARWRAFACPVEKHFPRFFDISNGDPEETNAEEKHATTIVGNNDDGVL